MEIFVIFNKNLINLLPVPKIMKNQEIVLHRENLNIQFPCHNIQ